MATPQHATPVPAVSVILPVYDRCHTVGAAIDSVLGQSWRDLELIVVDDASSDAIADLMAGISDRRVRFLRRPANGGAAAARNTGLAHARGAFIAFQDSDDLWLPGKLALQMRLLGAQPNDVGVVVGQKILYGLGSDHAYGPGKVVIAPDPSRPVGPGDDQLARLLTENRISVQSALFRRSCYPGDDWFDPRAGANEDWEFAVRLAQHTRICEHPEPVVLGFASPDSISRNHRRQLRGAIRVLKGARKLRQRYAREYAGLQYSFGRSLLRAGRRRRGLRFVATALRARPDLMGPAAAAVLRRVLRRFRFRLKSLPEIAAEEPRLVAPVPPAASDREVAHEPVLSSRPQ